MNSIVKYNLKSTGTLILILVLFSSFSFSQNVKIQLDEQFNFIGLDNYDSVFKDLVVSNNNSLLKMDNDISVVSDDNLKKALLLDRYEVEKITLAYEFKNHIQKLLLKYYNTDIISERLGSNNNTDSRKHDHCN